MFVIFSLLNITLPLLDLRFPAIKLNKVVFPDPLGPIIPVIDPFFIFKEQLFTAARPPKYLETLSTCKISEFFIIYFAFLSRLKTLSAVLFKSL